MLSLQNQKMMNGHQLLKRKLQRKLNKRKLILVDQKDQEDQEERELREPRDVLVMDQFHQVWKLFSEKSKTCVAKKHLMIFQSKDLKKEQNLLEMLQQSLEKLQSHTLRNMVKNLKNYLIQLN